MDVSRFTFGFWEMAARRRDAISLSSPMPRWQSVTIEPLVRRMARSWSELSSPTPTYIHQCGPLGNNEFDSPERGRFVWNEEQQRDIH